MKTLLRLHLLLFSVLLCGLANALLKFPGPRGTLDDFAEEVTRGSLVSADMNGDGLVDIVFADDNVKVFTNSLSGFFTQEKIKPFGDFSTIHVLLGSKTVAVGDVNGDNLPDIVLGLTRATDEPTPLSVFLQDENGAYQEVQVEVSLEEGDNIWVWDVALADLNQDGHLDVVALAGGSGVAVLENNGMGNFTARQVSARGSVEGSVDSADVNGDGRADLIVLIASSVIAYINNGDGTFDEQIIDGLGGEPHSVAVADLDGDGDVDLATVGDDLVIVYDNDGTGTFTRNIVYRHDVEGKTTHWEFINLVDIDGNGLLDLVFSNWYFKGVWYIPQVAPMQFTQLYNEDPPKVEGGGAFGGGATLGDRTAFITFADVNGDGLSDLVGYGGYRKIEYALAVETTATPTSAPLEPSDDPITSTNPPPTDSPLTSTAAARLSAFVMGATSVFIALLLTE